MAKGDPYYLVSYELKSKTQDYSGFHAELNSWGATSIMSSASVVRTGTADAGNIAATLRVHMGVEDVLLVSLLTNWSSKNVWGIS